MARRYHESKKSGMNHKSDKFNDEFRHNKDMSQTSFNDRVAREANYNDFYAGMDARRRQELEDAGMIHEDQRAIANLPQEVMIKAYPIPGRYLPEGLDDTIRGIDHQIDYDDGKRQSHIYPKKV